MAHTILRMPVVMERTGLSRSAIYQRIAQETFPKPIPIGRRAVGWLEADIEKWVIRCIERAQGIPASAGAQK